MRKQAELLKKKEDIDKEGLEDIVAKLKTSLEDCTGVCILEGFQKQEPMILVDAILKELGKTSITLALNNNEQINSKYIITLMAISRLG